MILLLSLMVILTLTWLIGEIDDTQLMLPKYADWLIDWSNLQKHVEGKYLVEYSIKSSDNGASERLTIPIRGDLIALDDLLHTASQWSTIWLNTIQKWWTNTQPNNVNEWIFGMDNKKGVGKLYCEDEHGIIALECYRSGDINWKTYQPTNDFQHFGNLYDYSLKMTSLNDPNSVSIHYRLSKPCPITIDRNTYKVYWHSFALLNGHKTTYYR